MSKELTEGQSVTRRFTVDRARTIGFMGDEARVYSTPMAVQDIEETCHDFLLERIADGQETVGTRVEIDHMAPTLEGAWVDVTITIQKVDGRAVHIEASVADPVEEVARARHSRFIVDIEKTRERLAAKKAKTPAD
jgi:predicted thioesterase